MHSICYILPLLGLALLPRSIHKLDTNHYNPDHLHVNLRSPSKASLQQIEQKRRDDEEKKKRSLDAKRMRKLKEKNLPRALQLINQANQMIVNYAITAICENRVIDISHCINNIIVLMRNKCQRSRLMYAGTHIVPIWRKLE